MLCVINYKYTKSTILFICTRSLESHQVWYYHFCLQFLQVNEDMPISSKRVGSLCVCKEYCTNYDGHITNVPLCRSTCLDCHPLTHDVAEEGNKDDKVDASTYDATKSLLECWVVMSVCLGYIWNYMLWVDYVERGMTISQVHQETFLKYDYAHHLTCIMWIICWSYAIFVSKLDVKKIVVHSKKLLRHNLLLMEIMRFENK